MDDFRIPQHDVADDVRIEVSVRLPDGTVINKVHYENANLWQNGYRSYYKGHVIRKLAEDVADEVDRQH